MINEEICTYEVAKLAKEKGFDEYEACNHIYEDDEQWYTLTTYTNAKGIDWSKDKFTTAPTQSLLQKWLREEKYLFIDIEMAFNGYYYQIIRTDKFDECIGTQIVKYFNGNKFDTYEQALEDALKYVLENLI